MAFSGNWLSGAMVQDPRGAVQHTADPAHGVLGDDQGPNTATYQAAATDDAGLASTLGLYPGEEWIVETGGRIIDTTDYESHARDDGDHGAALQSVYGEKITQFADEQYLSARNEGLPGEDINPVALQRGRNGLTVNNPDGFRRGWDYYSWINRHFAVARERQHDHRIIFPDLPYAQTADQAAAPISAGAYPTSFGALARSITNIAQRPTARREPPPMGADLVSDGGPIEPAVDNSWVVG